MLIAVYFLYCHSRRGQQQDRKEPDRWQYLPGAPGAIPLPYQQVVQTNQFQFQGAKQIELPGAIPLPSQPAPQAKQLQLPGSTQCSPVQALASQPHVDLLSSDIKLPASTTEQPSQSPSQVTLQGNRKSLLIGINYYGTQNELHGCIDDVLRMLGTIDTLGFPREGDNCKVLADDPSWPRERHPTMANIRTGIAWLVKDVKPGDALFLHYSGHGGQCPRTDGKDGLHETLCPVDMETAGMLLDCELFDTLVRPLPSGCRLTCILDSCHSGGVLDLPYLFTGTPENLAKALSGEAVQMALTKNWMQDFQRWQVADDPSALLADVASMGLGLWQLWGQYQAGKKAGENGGFAADQEGNIGVAVAEVVAFTGCRSDQTSADVGDAGSQFSLKPVPGNINVGGHVLGRNRTGAGGALTSAFVESMADPAAKGASYLELLEHIRQRLAEEGFSQVPQLASTLILDLRKPFSMDTISLSAKPGDRSVNSGFGDSAYSSGLYGQPFNQGGDGLSSVVGMLSAEAVMHQAFGNSGQNYSQPYGQPFGQSYGQPYGQPFGQPYSQPYGQPYGLPFGQPYSQPYSQPYGQAYRQPYSQPCGQGDGYSNAMGSLTAGAAMNEALQNPGMQYSQPSSQGDGSSNSMGPTPVGASTNQVIDYDDAEDRYGASYDDDDENEEDDNYGNDDYTDDDDY